MAVRTLTSGFRRLGIIRKEIISGRYSTQTAEVRLANIAPFILQANKSLPNVTENHVAFTARSIGLTFDIPKGDLPLRKIIESPLITNYQIENPIKTNIEKSDITTDNVMETPGTANIIEKRAHRMIVIRRKKMKKHKRKKWLKKWRALLQKKRLRKKRKKEKAFQAELQEIYQEALKFDPKEYVNERLHLLTRERLPNRWRGHRVTETMVKQFIEESRQRKEHKKRLRTYRLKLD